MDGTFRDPNAPTTPATLYKIDGRTGARTVALTGLPDLTSPEGLLAPNIPAGAVQITPAGELLVAVPNYAFPDAPADDSYGGIERYNLATGQRDLTLANSATVDYDPVPAWVAAAPGLLDKEGNVAPDAAPDIHLNEVFGTEELDVPLVLSSLGTSGTVTVDLSASTSSTGSPAVDLPDVDQVTYGGKPHTGDTVSLTGATYPFDVTTRVKLPSTLNAGTKYYLVATVTGPSAGATLTATTTGSYEFLGTPISSAAPLFNGSLSLSSFAEGGFDDFFSYIRNLLLSDTANRAINRAPHVVTKPVAGGPPVTNPANGESFIEAFEGLYTYPYLDSKGIPTIAIGVNLNTFVPNKQGVITSATWTTLKGDLTAYSSKNTSGKTDAQILTWLKSTATTNGPINPKKPTPASVITTAQAQSLLDSTWTTFQTQAAAQLSPNWAALGTYGQAAMTDMQYNGALAIYNTMRSALTNPAGPDFLQAAFQICNSTDAYNTASRGLNLRREAEFQGLLWQHTSLIGDIIT